VRAALLRLRVDHRVHRDRGVVVHPEDFLAVEVLPDGGLEAAGGRGAVLDADVGQFHGADAGHRMVADGNAEQRGRRAQQGSVRIEDVNPCRDLVDDREGPVAAVFGFKHPLGGAACCAARMLLLEIGARRIERMRRDC
jgi:hypothetical protein